MIRIPIVSTFNSKGFKQAETSTQMLSKQFKNLAVSLGAAFSVRKVVQFSKASIKAFIEEDKAVQTLSRNLDNLGMAYNSGAVESYITRMQYATSVADGELRPALIQLLNSTRNLSAAQDLLGLSLDVSAGTGKNLGQVTQALSRAYSGNLTSLGRLNLGISKADLASKSFNEITDELSKRFSGQATKAAKTYSGQLAILSAAAGDAQEVLGQKLVTSLDVLVGKDAGVEKLANTFNDMAEYVGNVAIGIAATIKQVKNLIDILPGNISGADLVQGIPVAGSWLTIFAQKGKAESIARTMDSIAQSQKTSARVAEMESAAALKNWLKEQRAAEKLRKEQEKTAKAAKAAREEAEKRRKILEKLSKAGDILDTEKASIEAALQNEKLSENEILRLKLKKAILNENADRALELAGKLADSQKLASDLRAELMSFKPSNPFQEWDDSITKIKNELLAIGNLTMSTPRQQMAYQRLIDLGKETGNQQLVEQGSLGLAQLAVNDIGVSEAALLESELAAAQAGKNAAMVQQMASTVNVYVQGTGGLDAQAKQEVVDAVVEASSYGFGTGWFRTTNRVAL